ncbi:unnamed protein product [Mesocestoides corti]|uniref:Short chain dehydrogenase n=1 Tax=Mesocestoides corti TaxID=53468 RepID=A0A0R3UCQ6_MESCO|nr:unnamed protein product [Mesocestoides corti]
MDRMSSDLSTELKSCGKSVSVMSLWPGVVRTELMMKFADEAGDTLPIDINAHTESPEFTGRVLAEIAKESRADIMSRSGRVFVVADVASSKGIKDIDRRSPLSFRSYKFLLHYAGWKKLAACVPGFLKVPYFFLWPASPRF